MALVRIDHSSETVKLSLPLYLILPDPGPLRQIPLAERKVLYLLHGLGDDASAWPRYTSIETLAGAYGLVVALPSAARSFYTDQLNGQKYFSYLVEELPEYLASLFGLRPKREDTFIAGNSMGGYGAFKAALLRPDLFAAAASFSGVLSPQVLSLIPADDPRRQEFTLLLGDLEELAGSQHDPFVWLERAVKEQVSLPRLFLSVGRQEDIYPLSGMFHSACQSLGVPSEYYEEDAAHDWFFWEREIHRFLTNVLGPLS